ncbi:MAG: MFS transporter [Oscillatoriales cyanobacterium C42_A2020_001]|nr:MFS transporter [Leptolyngbyaceae cyanobacterium C42_A2020_001]
MVGQAVDARIVEPIPLSEQPAVELTLPQPMPTADELSIPAEKSVIRTSLRASTLDGMFATIFSNAVGGVLLSNFLVELHASPTQIGMLASIPMLANLIQPIGAFLGDRTRSRHWYCFWIYAPSRVLWLILAVAIAFTTWSRLNTDTLILLTLAIVFVTHFVGALGSASWLSWLATLVPRRLRGRYFGVRNSAASLTNLLSVPLLGWLVSSWYGGSLQGYGIVVILGVIAGLVSLGFQFFMVDVNPQVQQQEGDEKTGGRRQEAEDRKQKLTNPQSSALSTQHSAIDLSLLKDSNFLFFLLYFGLWMFAVNLSAPFFNLYLLDSLHIDLRWVTIYNSLQAGANLVMLVLWGKLADRIGNRPLLLGIGVLVAVTPLLWLGTSGNDVSLWILFPALHLLAGGTWAAIDLCNNNLQLGVAPVRNQATYFAIAAAVSGVCGALGTTAGGFLVEYANYGGIPGLFALSGVVRLGALLPLMLVHEQRGQSFRQMMRTLFPEQTAAIAKAED